MKTLIVLIATFFVSLFFLKMTDTAHSFVIAGNIAMAAMLCFAATGHVLFTKGMELMIPPFIPFKRFLVLSTGLLEVLFAFCLIFQIAMPDTGIVCIIFFILILPANIYAALNRINFEKATTDGEGIRYLWFRIPLQLLFIAWVYYFSVKPF